MDSVPAELTRLLAQFHVPPGAPWAFVTTPEPIAGDGSPVRLQIDCKLEADLYSLTADASGASFARGWQGYRLELLGLLVHLDLGGIQATAPGLAFKGTPPRLKLRDRQTGMLTLDVALLCQRAYVPDSRGEPPGLCAELHWWPGQTTVQDYYRASAAGCLTEGSLAAAERARPLLHQLVAAFAVKA